VQFVKEKLEKSERERISALHRYSILDTPPEKRFDELTKIASIVCDMPIALISLVDEHRHWFKSRIGVEATEGENRLDCFCKHAIEIGETLIVPDTRHDPRFQTNPMVLGPPGIRFYAGALITTEDGFHLGTLCVMDARPRQLLDFQKRFLEHLARSVILELDSDFRRNRIKNLETVSLGEFAAGIAHEINNPLAVIHARMGHLKRLAQAGKIAPDTVVQNAGKIEKVVDRIHSIVRSLCTETDQSEKTCLSSMIQDVLFFFEERLQGSGIDFQVEGLPHSESIWIKGRSVQIGQALLNLLTNAHDAIEDTSSEKWIRIRIHEDEQCVQIRVCDGAPRIPEKIREQLFRPYFTTKRQGKGTGLGLSVSRSLIESFGGRLFLEQTETEKAFVVELSKAPR